MRGRAWETDGLGGWYKNERCEWEQVGKGWGLKEVWKSIMRMQRGGKVARIVMIGRRRVLERERITEGYERRNTSCRKR